jgi:ribosomal protein L25 (general stress protein Ctc)
MSELYPGLTSTKDAVLLTEEDIPWDEKQAERELDKNKKQTIVASTGDALWAYRNEGKINGVVVRESDRNLNVERDDQLQQAFQPHNVPHSEVFWLSPDDTESIEKYNQLLQRVYDGTAIIVDEQKQYDTAKGKFMVWIRWDEVWYELNPRHSYLKEAKK